MKMIFVDICLCTLAVWVCFSVIYFSHGIFLLYFSFDIWQLNINPAYLVFTPIFIKNISANDFLWLCDLLLTDTNILKSLLILLMKY